MKVNVIFLDYHRHDFTIQVKSKNFSNAGYPFDHVVIDMQGISKAINAGIKQSLHYDAVVTMANDILMPDNWLAKMVEAATAILNTGMCGIHCVESLGPVREINGIKVHPSYTAFGNVLIPMTAIRKIGAFNEDYDPYSMNDSDYALRLNETGHLNYYLSGMKAEHIGHDVGQPTDYRRMKDKGLEEGAKKFGYWSNKYRDENNYTIELNDWI